MVAKRHQGGIQFAERAERFDRWWYLIHGYTSIERHHRIANLQKGAVKLAKSSYYAKHGNHAMEALHENKRLMASLRNVNQTVHYFRLGTVGRRTSLSGGVL